ncbi:hypothetical protein V5O48_019093 [Marasmius crinis-equi]|uniref:Uncharacterized protein n=1 Tax=Marasmius crinis-equi TaxID=585013 RepID=A0ABR3EJC3_9AGAR
MNDYLSFLIRQWDPISIGHKLEAFAVARCDATKVIKSQKGKAEALKKYTVRLVQDGLGLS